MSNIAVVRDAFLLARGEVAETFQEAVEEFYRPDKEIQLAIAALMLPPEMAELLDDETKRLIAEVTHGKPSKI